MGKISTELIKDVIYKLCFEANTTLEDDIYSKIYQAFLNSDNQEEKGILKSILLNAKIANETKLPLCQDTGQVIVFLEVGQNINFEGEFIYDAINSAVEKCYIENFFRKSVVKNSVFDRTNTKTNTPVVVHISYIKEEEVRISVLIKGAGSENKSKLEMLLPTLNEDEIAEKIGNLIVESGVNACPPMFIGVGIGLTADMACVMSKKALIESDFSQNDIELAEKIKLYINKLAPQNYKNSYVLDLKILTNSTHIACMPAAICINCHSNRHKKAVIKNGQVIYNNKKPKFVNFENLNNNTPEIMADDVDSIKNLKKNQDIFLSGEIYVARDMAHKRLINMMNNGEALPFEIKDKIIFYAGPCPKKEGFVIGSIGPTTASRMDRYAVDLYNNGLLATIGKGDRDSNVIESIRKNNAKYFTVTGGIAALLANKVVKSEIIAFEDLGAEALYKIHVDKLPVKVFL